MTADEVTAGWLSAALRTRHPRAVVGRAEPVQLIDGTATKVLLRLAYDPHGPRAGLPDRMCVKGGFGAYREYLGGMGLYSGEVRFYNEIAPLYELTCPTSYFGLTQTDPVQGIVALEDLGARGATFARATRPLGVELARAGLDALAALHGQSWQDDRPRQLGVDLLLPTATEPILRDFLTALPERFAAPRGFAAPVVLHDPDRLRAAFTTYRAEAQRAAACVVHGDAHIGNAYVEPDGRVGFLDWQTVAIGPWVHDVNYFLVSALDVPDRRAHERDLLGHYLKALATFGVSAPGPDEAWSGYRQATVHGFLSWLCNLDRWQPAEVNTATYARFGMAMVDHDTYAALGV
ncbi:phosphotransferase [Pseudonocardia lacus]|uniref:phosphotransferase n=1 Tax=Pseudonocardia lacus TaxID=2835865 RepID=UPI001BDCF885|nr:phosphotransferase [Pseudonocardia lacus]